MSYGPIGGDVQDAGHEPMIEIRAPGRVSVTSTGADPAKAAGAMAATALLAMTNRIPTPDQFVTSETGVPVQVTHGDPVPGVSEETAGFLAQFLDALVLAEAGTDAVQVYERVLSTVTPPPASGAGAFDPSCCPVEVVVEPLVGGTFHQYLVQDTSTSPPAPVAHAQISICGGHSNDNFNGGAVPGTGVTPCYGTLTDANGLATFDGHLGPIPVDGFSLQKLTVTLAPNDSGPVCQPPVSFGHGLELQQTSQASTCGPQAGSATSGEGIHQVLSPGAVIQPVGNQTMVCSPPGQGDCGLYVVASPAGGAEQLAVLTDAGAGAGSGIEVDVCTQGYDAYGNAFPQPTCGFTAFTDATGAAVFDGQSAALIPSGTQLASAVLHYQGQLCTPPVEASLVAPPPLF
jgi:hypothetical protein